MTTAESPGAWYTPLSRRRLLQLTGSAAAVAAAGLILPAWRPTPAAAAPPADLDAAAGGLGPVTVLSRSANRLDVFAAGADGRVWTAAWGPGDTSFQGWWPVGTLEVAPCSPIGAVSRAPDKMDLVVAGLDGRVWTAAWRPGDTAFRGWWPVGDLRTTPAAAVSVVSRSTDRMDVFATDTEGWVHTAAWQPGDTAFRGWWPVAGGRTRPGAAVNAVSRSTDKLNVFVTGLDGRVRRAAWQPGDSAFQGWWTVGTLSAPPGAPVTVLSRSTDRMDAFVTGTDGRVRTAAWQPGDTDFRDGGTVGSVVAPPGAPVGAVSRATDKMDVFVTDADGWVRTAAWRPGDTAFRGWWTVASGRTLPGAPVLVASRATDLMDVTVAGLDARVHTAAWQPADSGTGFRGWWPVGTLATGLPDPQVGNWAETGTAWSAENTDFSEEAQGVATDGTEWFAVSNNTKSVRRIGFDGHVLAAGGIQQGKDGGHVGAPGVYDGWIYVPVQNPYGVWKAPVDLSHAEWRPVGTTDNRLSWCAVNPLNGRLYTSEYDIWDGQTPVLYAYDRDTLQRRPEDDITLGPAPINLDRIQGGVFTSRGRVLLVRSDPNGIFCFSARTGACLGARMLGDFGSSGSEVESVAVLPWRFDDGSPAAVHVLELDNDWSNPDDCYLHGFSAPVPL